MIQINEGLLYEKTGPGVNDKQLCYPRTSWHNVVEKPSWLDSDTKPSYAWDEISDKPTIPDASKFLPLSGGTMTGRLVINKAGSAQTDTAAGHIALQKDGTDYAHIRPTASNSNLAIESKGGIILYGGASDNGTAFSSANYVAVYSGSLRGVGTVDLTGFRNLGLSGTISHGSVTLTLPSKTGTIALEEDIPDSSKFVTTDTEQTISGDKIFSKGEGQASTVIRILSYAGGSPTRGYGVEVETGVGTDNAEMARYGSGGVTHYVDGKSFYAKLPSANGTLLLDSDIDLSRYLPLTGGVLTGTLTATDVYTNHQFIIPATNSDGRGSGIYETKDATNLFGFLSGDTNHATLNVGATGKNLAFRGKATYPTYNGNNIATTSYVDTKVAGYVTLGTQQTISEEKLFSKGTNGNVHTTIRIMPYNGASPTRAYGIEIDTNGKTVTYGTSGISISENEEKYSLLFPSADGTLALKEDIPDLGKLVTTDTAQTISGAKTFTKGIVLQQRVLTTTQSITISPIHIVYKSATSTGITRTERTYTFPDKDGQLAVTADLADYATLDTEQRITGKKTFNAGSFSADMGSGRFRSLQGRNGMAMMYEATSTPNGFILETDTAGTDMAHFRNATMSSDEINAGSIVVRIPKKSGLVALTSDLPEERIVIRVKWLNWVNSYTTEEGWKFQAIRAKIEFLSGRHLLQPNDKIVLAQLRKRIHTNPQGARRECYKYRADSFIYAKDLPDDDIVTFVDLIGRFNHTNSGNYYEKDLTGLLTASSANKVIYIVRHDPEDTKNANWYHVSNSVSFRVLYNSGKDTASFVIEGGA